MNVVGARDALLLREEVVDGVSELVARVVHEELGNLAERVPWLFGFWMLTLFPQPVLQFYFMFVQGIAQWYVLPIEVAMCLGFEVIYVAQLVVAYKANRRLVAKAAADFHLQPVDLAPGGSSAAL